MNNSQTGFMRGIIYPLLAVGLASLLSLVLKQGWLTDSGALALTGIIGWVDHKILPQTYLQ